MLKCSHFRAETEHGPSAIPLFGKADAFFEKTASAQLLPEVTRYIACLRPQPDSQYVLVNAMGAGEYYGSNINGDYFSEASLIHKPDDWQGNPILDRIRSKDWPYGFPTFYRAHPYAHHRNKDSTRAFGDVELAAWNPDMKRVELVTRVDRDKCAQFGGQGTWDKLKSGAFPDVSMGTKVPFDTCFPAGTLVRTSTGHRPIEDLHLGDEVLTHTGSTRRVTQVMRRQTEGLTTVRAAGLPEIRSTDNHPFLVLRREQARTCKGTVNGQRCRHSFDGLPKCRRCGQEPEFDLVWSAAENLKLGDYLAMPVTSGATHVAPERARLLGYYLGDGYVIRQRTGKAKKGDYRDMGVGFSVGHAEENHLEELLKTLRHVTSANDPCVYETGSGRRAFSVSLYDQDLAAWVQEFGGRGSEGKRLADEVFEWEASAKIQLVAGYIDTDGSFDEASGQTRIASVNRGLLLDVQRVLLSLGCPASVCFAGSGGGYEGSSDCWYLSLSAFQAQTFRDVTCKIKERKVGWDSPQSFLWKNYWLTPVKSVSEEDVETEVFNISVEEDESYIAEGRAVHNCSICLDQRMYQDALDTFDPAKHKHPGTAVLDYHRSRSAIRGLSITRADYCEHALKQMNRIFPDGKKSFVLNDFPAFFDISFVFIGADKTAKTMLFIFSSSVPHAAVRPSAQLADDLGMQEPDGESKTASVHDEVLKMAFGFKLAKDKGAEIDKRVIPSQFAGKAVPVLTRCEEDLPNALMDQLSTVPPEQLLSTLGGMGILLKPREFQRMTLIQLGMGDLADEMDSRGEVFEKSEEREPMGVSPENFRPALAQKLSSLVASRSLLAPEIEQRAVMTSTDERPKTARAPSHSKDLLDKIAAAYNGYRQDVMELVAHSQHLLSTAGTTGPLQKLSSIPVRDAFSPLSAAYLQYAYDDEYGVGCSKTGGSRRGEGSPLREHVEHR